MLSKSDGSQLNQDSNKIHFGANSKRDDSNLISIHAKDYYKTTCTQL